MPDLHGWITQQVDAAEEYALDHIIDPTNALRRCTADRKILAIHKPTRGFWIDYYACEGCGMNGSDPANWITDHTNDCPTLQALAEAYGLTEEQLDRPEAERPEPGPGFLIPDAIVNGMAETLLRMSVEVPPALRGPNFPA